jgi:hypothetical protein
MTCVPILLSMRLRWRYGCGGMRISVAWSTIPNCGVQYTSIRYMERLAEENAVRPVGSKRD